MDCASLCHELFRSGNGLASNAHDFHTVVVVQLVSDRSSGQVRLALHEARTGFANSVGTRTATPAFAGEIRSQRSRANQNKSCEHASFPR
jgi:diaminopimelate epimerase